MENEVPQSVLFPQVKSAPPPNVFLLVMGAKDEA